MTASCGVLWVAYKLPNDCCSTSTTDTFRHRKQQSTSFVTLKHLIYNATRTMVFCDHPLVNEGPISSIKGPQSLNICSVFQGTWSMYELEQ